MRIMTILGTRPEIIRLSLVIRLLDRYATEHCLVHTGQNFDDRLSEIFFRELEVRHPDIDLAARGNGFGTQVARILESIETHMLSWHPDRILILGDTNSGLCSIVARRLGIPVFHMEAGNRCFDDRVPEEVNRRVIDHSSTVLLPYTSRSKANLVREGFHESDIFVVGNPIFEVLQACQDRIVASDVLVRLGLTEKQYVLVTAHRAETVDDKERFTSLLSALVDLSELLGVSIVYPLHPRSRSRAESFGLQLPPRGVTIIDPLGFADFVRLEQSALCIVSDSGTVQEEACILHVPNVTVRDVTERPETVDCGSNFLAGVERTRIVDAVRLATSIGNAWVAPAEYCAPNVAATVARLVLGYREPDAAELQWRKKRRR